MPKNLKILLIEDDPDDAELLLALLEEVGHQGEVVHEKLLTLGLRRLANEKFDVVFLDLSLPDSWGIETLQKVRKTAPSLPVILMTGAAMPEISVQAAQEGAAGFLLKSELTAEQVDNILLASENWPEV
jgi:two-component system, cell cycle response regulator